MVPALMEFTVCSIQGPEAHKEIDYAWRVAFVGDSELIGQAFSLFPWMGHDQ